MTTSETIIAERPRPKGKSGTCSTEIATQSSGNSSTILRSIPTPRPAADGWVPESTFSTARPASRRVTARLAKARAPPRAAAPAPATPQASPAAQVAATARTSVARSMARRALLFIFFERLLVVPGHTHEGLDAGPDARAETYPFEPGCRVESSVQPSAPEVADGQSCRQLDADGTGHGGGPPHAFDFRVDGRGSANTPGAAGSRPCQNFDETARNVILSLVSRRRPARVRTKFHRRS